MVFRVFIALLLLAVPAWADSLVENLPATTTPVPAGSCFFVDQVVAPNTSGAVLINGQWYLSSKLCSGYASALGALIPANNLSDVASTSLALTNLGGALRTRFINTTSPLTGGGDLTSDRTIGLAVPSTCSLLGGSGGNFTCLGLGVGLQITGGNVLVNTAGGNVTGPPSSVGNNLTAFADTTGLLLKDSGIAIGSVVQTTRKINTTAPLSGGQSLANDATLSLTGPSNLTTFTSNVIPKGAGTSSFIASSLSDNGTTVATAEAISVNGFTDSSMSGNGARCVHVDNTGHATVASGDCASGGTVTSITVTVPTELTVSPATITSSGTFAITKSNENANTVWAGPTSGGAAAPGFRALVAADVTGLVPVGGTPTAQVGLSVIPGTATTFMRSDAAPALAATGVNSGTYSNPTITLNAAGQVTAVAAGGIPSWVKAAGLIATGAI